MTNRKRFAVLVASLGAITCSAMFAQAITVHNQAGSQSAVSMVKLLNGMTSHQVPLVGKAGAPLKVVGTMDYQCPACRAYFEKVVDKVAHTRGVSLYVEQFPLPMHKLAVPAATLALKAEDSGKFPAVHRALLQGNDLSPATLKVVGAKFHLSVRPTPETTRVIAQNMKDMLALGVSSTPSFIVSDGKTIQRLGWREVLTRLSK